MKNVSEIQDLIDKKAIAQMRSDYEVFKKEYWKLFSPFGSEKAGVYDSKQFQMDFRHLECHIKIKFFEIKEKEYKRKFSREFVEKVEEAQNYLNFQEQ